MKDINDYTADFQRGEEAGFTFLYNSLYGSLVYYAKRITYDEEIAKDIVQNSFAKIWKSHSTFFHPQVIKSWMYTTVRNYCLNHLVNVSRHNDAHESIAYFKEQDYEKPILDRLIAAELHREVFSNLNVLPPKCREIFVLLYEKEMTCDEIAGELNLSISTVKTQKQRGLDIIRKKLGFTKEQYLANCKKLMDKIRNSHMRNSRLSKLYGIEKETIKNIKSGLYSRRYV